MALVLVILLVGGDGSIVIAVMLSFLSLLLSGPYNAIVQQVLPIYRLQLHLCIHLSHGAIIHDSIIHQPVMKAERRRDKGVGVSIKNRVDIKLQ
jgi:hypothetical protein